MGADGTDFPRTAKLARVIQADFKRLRSWFDRNDDYTLIIYSDHGVDEYHYGVYRMHGTTANGNEPFLMVYNKNFIANNAIKTIDVVDVLPTLSQ